MTRTTVKGSVTALLLTLVGAGCGEGEATDEEVALPDEQVVSYSERSADNPEPPNRAPQSPLDESEAAGANVFGPDGSGPPVSAPPPTDLPDGPPATCDPAGDGCAGCTTELDCCACYGDATVCDAVCSALP